MPQVEEHPPTRLPFVFRHNLRLDRAGSFDGGKESLRIEPEDALRIALELLEECRIPQSSSLYDLRETRRPLPNRQRREGVDVNSHKPRLMKGTHQVLAAGEVHPDLPADARIDHREQGGRHL